MELYNDLVKQVLKRWETPILWQLKKEVDTVVEKECYIILRQIKEILEDERLSDKECFLKIEAIVLAFEEHGSGCGCRHDE